MGLFWGLNGALFSILLFMLTVVSNAKAPLSERFVFYSQSRMTLPEAPLRIASKPFWKSSTLK
ncbi:TPA: hypothetical protein I7678_18130 [Vibrio vulnificus]|nr:hypothetical protein [Vibrio vulnificus]